MQENNRNGLDTLRFEIPDCAPDLARINVFQNATIPIRSLTHTST
jgi:hypothetical protein